MFSRVEKGRSWRQGGVHGLHFPSEHLLLSRKGMLSPDQGQNLAWFRVTILWKGVPRKEAN